MNPIFERATTSPLPSQKLGFTKSTSLSVLAKELIVRIDSTAIKWLIRMERRGRTPAPTSPSVAINNG
jgi:hypothetical protein